MERATGETLTRWAGEQRVMGVVRILERHGFGAVAPGQVLIGTADGQRIGSVYGGALNGVALPLLVESLTSPGQARAHVTEQDAPDAGLACGGAATLLGHPLPTPAAAALGEAVSTGLPAALASSADGTRVLVVTGPDLSETTGSLGAADDEVLARLRELVRLGVVTTELLEVGDDRYLVDLWVPVPTVLTVGTGALVDALAAQAKLLNWNSAHETTVEGAAAAVADFTASDVLVLLDHSPSFDPVLIDLLRSGRGFAGALGSRRTQSARRDRLVAAGLSVAELARLRGPVGLDIGARTPQETAVSIVAEVVSVRSGRSGSALATTGGRIGA